jgi:hypothetical protein
MISIRVSMLPSYADCPRRAAAKQWRRLIVDKGFDLRELEKPIGTAVGDGGHEIARLLCIAKRDGIAVMDYDVIDAGIEKFRDSSANGILFDETTSNKNDAEKQVQMLGRSFCAQVLPNVMPEIVECHDGSGQEVTRSARFEDRITITMHPDLETRDNTIEDWKFGKLFPYTVPQLGGYSLGRHSNGSPRPVGLTMWHLPRTSLKKAFPGASPHKYDVALCEKAAFATISRACADVTKFQESGEPWCFPANPLSMMCSDKYCPAWGSNFCEVWKCQ